MTLQRHFLTNDVAQLYSAAAAAAVDRNCLFFQSPMLNFIPNTIAATAAVFVKSSLNC